MYQIRQKQKIVTIEGFEYRFSSLFGETDPVVGIEVIAEPALDGIKAEAGAL